METTQKTIIASSVLILAFVALLFSISNPSGLILNGCKNTTETYTELEPYEEEQCIDIPFIDNVCQNETLLYSKTNQQCYFSPLDTLNSECMIENLDNEGGNFIVEVGIMNKNEEKIGETKTIFIYPQSSYTFKFSYETDIGGCYCNEKTIPTKQVCIDQRKTKQQCYDITKFREVTKNRTIEKCD